MGLNRLTLGQSFFILLGPLVFGHDLIYIQTHIERRHSSPNTAEPAAIERQQTTDYSTISTLLSESSFDEPENPLSDPALGARAKQKTPTTSSPAADNQQSF
jgi:hypothetical protein